MSVEPIGQDGVPKYHVWLDYKGYMIDETSYRVLPAPLLGSRFTTGRTAYTNLDVWQVGALTDWTKGGNQKFLVDPSRYFTSTGIDVTRLGEFQLEKDIVSGVVDDVNAITSGAEVTARYSAFDRLWIGMRDGKVYTQIPGSPNTWVLEVDTTAGPITGFYEFSPTPTAAAEIFAMRGNLTTFRRIAGTWFDMINFTTGTANFTNGSDVVTRTGGTAWDESVVGRQIKIKGGVNVDQTFLVSEFTDSFNIKISVDFDGITDTVAAYEMNGIIDLFFAEILSDTGYGMFGDGIRSSINGVFWEPEPPDPLWLLPISDRQTDPLALQYIPNRGWIIGSVRGLWNFTGGGAAVQIWDLDNYANIKNFRGMDNWGPYAIFGVEDQGLFYTDGSSIQPTNLNFNAEPAPINSVKDVMSLGYDIYALVAPEDSATADSAKTWQLARCNLITNKVPAFWSIVKTLSKEPAKLAAVDRKRIRILNVDNTVDELNPITGPFQASGNLVSSLADENLVLLEKLYRKNDVIVESFPVGTTIKLGFRLLESSAFTDASFTGDGTTTVLTRNLSNPTVGNRIQTRVTLETTDTTKTPIVNDMTWTYFLERPADESSIKRAFNFTILAEDKMEKLDFDTEEEGRDDPRERQEIVDDVFTSRSKKELLNYVGANNVSTPAIDITYTGGDASRTLTIDRTNQIITTGSDTVPYGVGTANLTITAVITALDALTDIDAVVIPDVAGTEDATPLFPDLDLEIKGTGTVYLGTDVHSIIFNTNAPGQFTLGLEGRGSDRLQISLREV